MDPKKGICFAHLQTKNRKKEKSFKHIVQG